MKKNAMFLLYIPEWCCFVVAGGQLVQPLQLAGQQPSVRLIGAGGGSPRAVDHAFGAKKQQGGKRKVNQLILHVEQLILLTLTLADCIFT